MMSQAYLLTTVYTFAVRIKRKQIAHVQIWRGITFHDQKRVSLGLCAETRMIRSCG